MKQMLLWAGQTGPQSGGLAQKSPPAAFADTPTLAQHWQHWNSEKVALVILFCLLLVQFCFCWAMCFPVRAASGLEAAYWKLVPSQLTRHRRNYFFLFLERNSLVITINCSKMKLWYSLTNRCVRYHKTRSSRWCSSAMYGSASGNEHWTGRTTEWV